ncbi:MAG: GIY-YIG nuclease family protein [Pseudomonadota bacterium]
MSKTTFIYAIRSRKWVKIGFTNNVKQRLSTIQTCNPTKVHLEGYVIGTNEEERQIQWVLNHTRTRGEWFQYVGFTVEIVAKIRELDTASDVLRWIKEICEKRLKECEGAN